MKTVDAAGRVTETPGQHDSGRLAVSRPLHGVADRTHVMCAVVAAAGLARLWCRHTATAHYHRTLPLHTTAAHCSRALLPFTAAAH